ncbi:MAG: dihydropyrimidinase [Chloroflexota bacterium]
MGTLFKNGTVINAGDSFPGDVLVEGEKIVLIGQSIPEAGHQVIDAKGKYLMPGGIDVHTHLELPFGGTVSSDDFSTGHEAAAFGGTTTHIDFVIQPKGGSLHDGLADWHRKADPKAQIDYGFHLAITDLRDEVMKEIPSLVNDGVTSLKLFMAYKNVFQVDDKTLFRAMMTAAENGMLIMVHAENGDVVDDLIHKYLNEGKTDPIYHAYSRPAAVEGEATGRAIALAGVAGCPLYVVHMTCEDSIQQLRLGRAKSLPVMGETCVQYLFLTEDDLAKPGYEGSKFVCSPPIRTVHDQNVLWQALRDRTLQVVSTDHCPFWYEGGINGRIAGKELGKGDFSKIPNGLPVIEDRMKIMWHYGVGGNHFDANRFVELMCTNPAKIFGLYPRKGTIAVGSDADIVVWDPEVRETVSYKTDHMNVDYNLFEGQEIQGGPAAVFLRGQQIVDGKTWKGHNGQGQFLKRSAHAPVL